MDYLGKWVSVYFNLHKNIFSIQRKGLVVDHVRNVKLLEAKFAVQPAGHAKVLVEKKKNVHAYVRGYITHSCMRRSVLAMETGLTILVFAYRTIHIKQTIFIT